MFQKNTVIEDLEAYMKLHNVKEEVELLNSKGRLGAKPRLLEFHLFPKEKRTLDVKNKELLLAACNEYKEKGG